MSPPEVLGTVDTYCQGYQYPVKEPRVWSAVPFGSTILIMSLSPPRASNIPPLWLEPHLDFGGSHIHMMLVRACSKHLLCNAIRWNWWYEWNQEAEVLLSCQILSWNLGIELIWILLIWTNSLSWTISNVTHDHSRITALDFSSRQSRFFSYRQTSLIVPLTTVVKIFEY